MYFELKSEFGWLYMQISFMNKSRTKLQLAGCICATASRGRISVMQHIQEEKCSFSWKVFIGFDHIITDFVFYSS